MSEAEFFTAVVESLDRLEVIGRVLMTAVCFWAGGWSLKFFIYAKNHRDLW